MFSKADSAAGQARVSEEIKALTALVARLNQPPEPVHGQEGNTPEGAPSSEPEPEPDRTTPERLTRTDPVEKAEDALLRLKGLIEKEEQKRAGLA